MTIARAETDDRKYPMTQELSIFFISRNSNACKLRQHNLFKHKRLIAVNWIQAVLPNDPSPELFTNSVSRQTEHIHFNVRADFFICEELRRENCYRDSSCDDAIDLTKGSEIFI